ARRRRGNAPSSPQRQRGARLQRKRPPRGRPPYTHNKPPVAGNNRSLPHQEPTPTRGLSPNKGLKRPGTGGHTRTHHNTKRITQQNPWHQGRQHPFGMGASRHMGGSAGRAGGRVRVG